MVTKLRVSGGRILDSFETQALVLQGGKHHLSIVQLNLKFDLEHFTQSFDDRVGVEGSNFAKQRLFIDALTEFTNRS